jgi:hypothetical protein
MSATVIADAQQDQAAIRDTLGHYLDGLRNGSVESLQQAFHPQAIMTGYLGPDLMIMPIQGLYDLVASTPSPAATGAPFLAEIGRIEIVGNTATAEVSEQGYLGANFQDRFQLLKVDGRWQIIAKLFTTT